MATPQQSIWAQSRPPECTAELKEGIRLAKAGQRSAAREHLIRAYSMCKVPTSLFNIGMTYREDKQADEAIQYLTQFLNEASPEHPMRSVAERVISELSVEEPAPAEHSKSEPDTDIKRLQGEIDDVDGDDINADGTGTKDRTSTSSDTPFSGQQLGGLGLGGTGIVAMGVGLYFGFQASSITKDIEGVSGSWEPSDTARYRDGEAAQRNMFISTGIGAAALIGGGVLYYLGSKDAKESRRMTLLPGLGSSSISVNAGGTF